MTGALVGSSCSPAPSTPLTVAAFNGDVAAVKTLLAANSADTAADGWSPLIWATRAGRVEVMTLLLDAGADPNQPDGLQGWTPLMHAQHVRQEGAARLLVDRGADTTRGAGRTSPLEMAVLDNDMAMLDVILAASPPYDQQRRAFDLAVAGGALADIDRPLFGRCRTAVVTRLLAFNPGLARVDEGVGSPLWWARRQGCEGTIARVTAAK